MAYLLVAAEAAASSFPAGQGNDGAADPGVPTTTHSQLHEPHM